MNRQEWKKQYSFYRKVNGQFRANMESSNYPCGYDDSIYENFARNDAKYLKNNQILARVIFQKEEFWSNDYHAVTEEFKDFRYQCRYGYNGKIVWVKRA
jgi:hypothetical protein